MRLLSRAFAILMAFSIGVPVSVPSTSAASVSIGPLGAVLDALRNTVSQLEQSARSLMEQGNVILAQQQMTLAGSVKQIIEQIAKTYESSLQKTADQLTIQEKNVATDIGNLAQSLQDSITLTSSEIQKRIYQTQTSSNQLLDKALPLSSRAPLIYGIQTRDILLGAGASPSDIEVLGYLLADPELKYRKPQVKVAGEVIPDQQISVFEGRVQVQVSDGVKQRIRLENSACAPLKTFLVELEVQYWAKGGWFSWLWKLFGRPETASLSAVVAPGDRPFDVTFDIDGLRQQDTAVAHTFDVASGQVNFGCEESKSALATWVAPDGAFNLNIGTCAWRKTNNVKSQAQTPAIGGLTATCSGTITGLDYQRIRFPFGGSVANCPGGGHGEIHLAGTYSLNRHETTPMRVTRQVTLFGERADLTLPTETGLVFKQLHVTVRRKSCGDLFDEALLDLPADLNEKVQQDSKNGAFKTTVQRSSIVVNATEIMRNNK